MIILYYVRVKIHAGCTAAAAAAVRGWVRVIMCMCSLCAYRMTFLSDRKTRSPGYNANGQSRPARSSARTYMHTDNILSPRRGFFFLNNNNKNSRHNTQLTVSHVCTVQKHPHKFVLYYHNACIPTACYYITFTMHELRGKCRFIWLLHPRTSVVATHASAPTA